MIVSSRMVKPHMVKKWAKPGTVHCRSLRWPATSTVSASTLGRDAAPGPVGVLLPRTDELGQPVEAEPGDPEADEGHGNAQDVSDRHECSSPSVTSGYLEQGRRRSASATWDFDAAQRIVGRSPGGPSWGVRDRRFPAPATPVGCPGGPPRNLAARAPSGGPHPDSLSRPPTGRATACNRPPRATFVPHRAALSSADLAVFGHREFAFTQRVVFPRSRGRSSEAEHQLPKLRTRVRFPSPALARNPRSAATFEATPPCGKPAIFSFVPRSCHTVPQHLEPNAFSAFCGTSR